MEKFAKNRGFTMIELVVGVAVFGLLIAVGLPSFSSAIKNSRISAGYNDTIGGFFIARSEAVKSSGNVTVCARPEDQSRTCKQGGGDWQHGLIVFVDNLPVVSDADITIGANDVILHVQPEFPTGLELTAMGSTDNTGPGNPIPYVTYNPNGSTNWRGAAMTICDDRGAPYSRTMNIVITGDIRRGRIPSNGTAPLDTFNNEATC